MENKYAINMRYIYSKVITSDNYKEYQNDSELEDEDFCRVSAYCYTKSRKIIVCKQVTKDGKRYLKHINSDILFEYLNPTKDRKHAIFNRNPSSISDPEKEVLFVVDNKGIKPLADLNKKDLSIVNNALNSRSDIDLLKQYESDRRKIFIEDYKLYLSRLEERKGFLTQKNKVHSL